MKQNIPGSAKEAKKDAEVAGADLQAKANELADKARAGANSADQRIQKEARDAQAELSRMGGKAEKDLKAGVDKFDKEVTEVRRKG